MLLTPDPPTVPAAAATAVGRVCWKDGGELESVEVLTLGSVVLKS